MIIGGGTATTDSPQNTDGTGVGGFSYVGRNIYNGVYLGNGYVLTAAHVIGGDIDFGGTVGAYSWVASSAVQVQNTVSGDAGNGLPTDLVTYRIQPNASGQLPNLAPLWLPTAASNFGTAVTLVAEGPWVARPSYWTVNQTTNPWTWTPSDSTNGNEAGFDYSSQSVYGVKRWGSNTINANLNYTISVNGVTNYIHGTQMGFYNFGTSGTGGVPNEAALANGDSGGGLFRTINGMTALAGILEAKFTASGQPNLTQSYGTGLAGGYYNYSSAVDIAWYANVIAAQMHLSQWTSTAASANWTDSKWNNFENSSAGQAGPNAAGALVNLLGINTGPTVINLNTAATVGLLNFSSPNSYTIDSGLNSLTFNNGGSGATLADWQGSHTISAAIVLAENLSVNVATAGTTLTLTKAVNGSGWGLTKIGQGQLTLSAANSYSGGTTMSAGTLNYGDPAALGAGTLTVTGTSTLQAGLGGTLTNNIVLNSGVAGTVDISNRWCNWNRCGNCDRHGREQNYRRPSILQ
ncbi:MAG: autotransporter-associated beta strand repeat-containing protein [Phycisphaerae bacterium]